MTYGQNNALRETVNLLSRYFGKHVLIVFMAFRTARPEVSLILGEKHCCAKVTLITKAMMTLPGHRTILTCTLMTLLTVWLVFL